MTARGVRRGLGGPLALSAVVHGVLVAAVALARPGAAPPAPPVYRVELVAAPSGPRQIGVVNPPTPAPPAARVPVRPATPVATIPVPNAKARPAKTPPAATPLPPSTATRPTTAAPAAGGESGGRGADVANVSTGGVEFPFPGYLQNIVRQIATRFRPEVRGALRAEVTFVIRRDGSVPASSIRLVTRSGVYSFDLEAQGAVEAAANANVFGALPAGYADDALPVTFRFDPKVIR